MGLPAVLLGFVKVTFCFLQNAWVKLLHQNSFQKSQQAYGHIASAQGVMAALQLYAREYERNVPMKTSSLNGSNVPAIMNAKTDCFQTT